TSLIWNLLSEYLWHLFQNFLNLELTIRVPLAEFQNFLNLELTIRVPLAFIPECHNLELTI
ncbi:MAG: hypothetical protein ACE5KT_04055, partial [Methanosarcinales archaeon]